jgi:hypothetical protein
LCTWIRQTIEQAGARTDLGARLAGVFEAAGLPMPTVRLESVIASGAAATDVIHLVTDLAATLLPKMERFGIIAASQIDPLSLARQIATEVGADRTLVGRAEVGAWTTT